MNPSRALTLLLAAVLVVGGIVYGVTRGGDDGAPAGTGPGTEQAPAGAVVVDFAYSPEKEQLLTPLLEEFNRSGAEVGGAPVRVRGSVVSSGAAAESISDG